MSRYWTAPILPLSPSSSPAPDPPRPSYNFTTGKFEEKGIDIKSANNSIKLALEKSREVSRAKYKSYIINGQVEKEQPKTPRSLYSEKMKNKHKYCVNILMKLDRPMLEAIRSEFFKHRLSVDIYDFIDIVLKTISTPDSDTDLADIEALYDIFQDDQSMEWMELTSYMVDLANAIAYSGVDGIHQYQITQFSTPSRHNHPLDFVKYFPSMEQLIVFERSLYTFKLYTLSLELTKIVRGHYGELICATHIPEYNLLVTSSFDRTIRFWNTQITSKDGTKTVEDIVTSNKLDVPYMAEIILFETGAAQMCLVWANGNLYSSDSRCNIYVWDVQKRELKCTLRGHSDIVMELLVLPKNSVSTVFGFPESVLLSASMDNTIRLWDMQNQSLYCTWTGHKKNHMKYIVSGGMDSFLLVWNADSPKPVFQIHTDCATEDYITGLKVIDNTPELIAVDTRGRFYIYDLRSFQLVQTITYSVRVESFTVVHDQRIIIAACDCTLVRLEKIRPLKQDAELREVKEKQKREVKRSQAQANSRGALSRVLGVLHYQINEIARYASEQAELSKMLETLDSAESEAISNIPILQGSFGGYLPVWASNKLMMLRSNKLLSLTEDSNFSPIIYAEFVSTSLSFLACVGRDVIVWDALTGKMEREYRDIMPSMITSACLDGRKKRLFCGDHIGNIHVFNYSNGAFMYALSPHSAEVSTLIYSTEFSDIVSSSWDGSIRYYDDDIEATDLFRTVRKHEKDIVAMKFASHVMISTDSLCQLVFSVPGNPHSDVIRFTHVVSSLIIIPYSTTVSFFVAATSNGILSLWKVLPQAVVSLVARWANFVEIDGGNSFSHSNISKNENSYKVTEKIKFDHVVNQEQTFSAITSMAYIELSQTLITGDENGYIKYWDISKIILQASSVNLTSKKILEIANVKSPAKKLFSKTVTHMEDNKTCLSVTKFPNLNISKSEALFTQFNLSSNSNGAILSNVPKLPDYLCLANSDAQYSSPLKNILSNRTLNKSSSVPILQSCRVISKDVKPANTKSDHSKFLAIANRNNEAFPSLVYSNIYDAAHDMLVSDLKEVSHNTNELDCFEFTSDKSALNSFLVSDYECVFPYEEIRAHIAFMAHSDAVTGIQVVLEAETPALLTWGFDGGIELWHLGKKIHMSSLINVMNHSLVNSADNNSENINSSKKWGFYADINAHAKMCKNAIIEVANTVSQRKKKQYEIWKKNERKRAMKVAPLLNAFESLNDRNKGVSSPTDNSEFQPDILLSVNDSADSQNPVTESNDSFLELEKKKHRSKSINNLKKVLPELRNSKTNINAKEDQFVPVSLDDVSKARSKSTNNLKKLLGDACESVKSLSSNDSSKLESKPSKKIATIVENSNGIQSVIIQDSLALLNKMSLKTKSSNNFTEVNFVKKDKALLSETLKKFDFDQAESISMTKYTLANSLSKGVENFLFGRNVNTHEEDAAKPASASVDHVPILSKIKRNSFSSSRLFPTIKESLLEEKSIEETRVSSNSIPQGFKKHGSIFDSNLKRNSDAAIRITSESLSTPEGPKKRGSIFDSTFKRNSDAAARFTSESLSRRQSEVMIKMYNALEKATISDPQNDSFKGSIDIIASAPVNSRSRASFFIAK